MRRRMRSQGGQDRSTVASRRIPGKGVTFPRSEAHRPQGREIILGVDREETFEPAGDDERLPIDLSDQISPVDRVFLSIQSGVRVCLRILVVVLTVLAGAELAYAFNLWAFKGGHIGAILAVAIACFVAARWITKD